MNACPRSERRRRRRAEDPKVPAGQFETCLLGFHAWRWRGPDHRLTRTIPAQQNRACRSSIAETIVRHAHGAGCMCEGHLLTVQNCMHPFSRLLRSHVALGVLWQTPQGKDRKISGRHDINVEARPPELHERRMLPAAGADSLDSRMHRQHCRTRHRIL